MDRRPLIILGSARKEGDTKKLVNMVFSKVETEQLNLLDYKIESYNYEGKYSTDDCFLQLFDTILKHHIIVFATPVYWYSMSGIMKTFFDRLTDITTVRKDIGRKMKGKEIFLISVGTDNSLPNSFDIPFRLTAEYLGMNFISTYYIKTNNLDSMTSELNNFLNNIKERV